MGNWKPITDAQRDGKIYWCASPYPSGLVFSDLKARFYRGRWWTSFGQQGWKPITGGFTHFARVDGRKSTQEIIGPMFRPDVQGVLRISPAA